MPEGTNIASYRKFDNRAALDASISIIRKFICSSFSAIDCTSGCYGAACFFAFRFYTVRMQQYRYAYYNKILIAKEAP